MPTDPLLSFPPLRQQAAFCIGQGMTRDKTAEAMGGELEYVLSVL